MHTQVAPACPCTTWFADQHLPGRQIISWNFFTIRCWFGGLNIRNCRLSSQQANASAPRVLICCSLLSLLLLWTSLKELCSYCKEHSSELGWPRHCGKQGHQLLLSHLLTACLLHCCCRHTGSAWRPVPRGLYSCGQGNLGCRPLLSHLLAEWIACYTAAALVQAW